MTANGWPGMPPAWPLANDDFRCCHSWYNCLAVHLSMCKRRTSGKLVMKTLRASYAATNGSLQELLPILAPQSPGEWPQIGVPPPVLPFVHQHKPHDRMDSQVLPGLLALALANGWPCWPKTSLSKNMWQRCMLTMPFQQVLGMNPAATNRWPLDVELVVDAKHKTAGEIFKAANG